MAVLLDNYRKILRIEALTMIEMSNKDIMPAVSKFIGSLSDSLNSKRSAVKGVSGKYEESIIEKASALLDVMLERTHSLEDAIVEVKKLNGAQEKANFYRDKVIGIMEELRSAADELEVICDRNIWPYPDYSEMLFGVK